MKATWPRGSSERSTFGSACGEQHNFHAACRCRRNARRHNTAPGGTREDEGEEAKDPGTGLAPVDHQPHEPRSRAVVPDADLRAVRRAPRAFNAAGARENGRRHVASLFATQRAAKNAGGQLDDNHLKRRAGRARDVRAAVRRDALDGGLLVLVLVVDDNDAVFIVDTARRRHEDHAHFEAPCFRSTHDPRTEEHHRYRRYQPLWQFFVTCVTCVSFGRT